MIKYKGNIAFNHKSSGLWDDLKLCPKGMSPLSAYEKSPVNPVTKKKVGGEKQFGITKEGFNFFCNHSVCEIPEFFMFRQKDMLEYLDSAKYEYLHPSQDYCNKSFMSDMFETKVNEVNALSPTHTFKFYLNVRENGTAQYLMPWDKPSQKEYYHLLNILLSNNTQGLSKADSVSYTQIVLFKFVDNLTKKIYIYMKPEFIKPYTAKELGVMLNEELDASSKDDLAIKSIPAAFVYKYRQQFINGAINIDDLIAEIKCIDADKIDKHVKESITKTCSGLGEILQKDIKDAKEIIEELTKSDEKLDDLNLGDRQVVFYGAPGTGKSHTIGEDYPLNDENTFRTTFHPDTDYASFVGCFKPTMKKKSEEEDAEEEISYTFGEQVFTKAYVEAWKQRSKGNPVFLVIDEINRGNCAQIFGDLFQLLDRNKAGYSEYEIKPDSDLGDHISKQALNVSAVFDKRGNDISEKINNGELLKFPRNLYILATMNTSDQSLYPMDSAFKRRWEWVYVPINYNDASQFHVEIDGKFYKWNEVIREINKKIKVATSSADKQLGNRFVMPDIDNIIASKTFVNKVMFYLWNDVFKDADEDEQIFKNVSYFEDFFEIDENSEDPKHSTLNADRINIGRVVDFIEGLHLNPDTEFVKTPTTTTESSVDTSLSEESTSTAESSKTASESVEAE